MTHPIITLADDVVTLLNATTFTQSFTATRVYVPRFNTESGSDVQVQVVPSSDLEGDGSGGYDARQQTIQVGIFKRLVSLVADEREEIDAMMDLCEEVRETLNRVRVGDTYNAVCASVTHEPIYSLEDIDERRVFLTVMSFVYVVDVEV